MWGLNEQSKNLCTGCVCQPLQWECSHSIPCVPSMLYWQKLFFAKSTRLLTPANRYVYILQVADLQKSLRQVRDSLSRTLNTEIQDTLHRLGGEGVMENIVQFQRGKHMASIEVPLGKNPSLNFVF